MSEHRGATGVRLLLAGTAVLGAVSASLLAWQLWGLRPLPDLALGRVVQLTPVPLFLWGIQTFGGYAKPLLFAGLAGTEAVLLTLLGLLWLRSRSQPLTLVKLLSALYLLVGLALLPLLGLGPFGARASGGPVQAALGPLLTYTAWAAGLWVARIALLRTKVASSPTRRRLVLAGASWTALMASGLAGSMWLLLRRSTLTMLATDTGRTPEVTPTPDFYVVSKNVLDPKVDARGWRLRVEGAVRRPLSLTLEELQGLPATEQWATMECISNPVGGRLIGNASWKGVRLSDLLHRVGVGANAYDVITSCADGYTESLEIVKAMSPEVLLVYEMNGEPLTYRHGAPVRLQVPGYFGLKSSKWVESIRVVDENYLGYWQQESNWTDLPMVYTECRIDHPPDGKVPREGMVLTGIAYAGLRGVSRVEVSTDSGTTWSEAELQPPLGPLTWRLWSLYWRPSSPGFHRVMARAYDGEGLPQEEEASGPGADVPGAEGVIVTGSAGIHKLNLDVLEG